MTIKISARTKRIKESPTIAISSQAAALRAAGKDVISLSAGEPDFNSPQAAKDAGIQAINDNRSKYTAVDGIPELKQAIIKKFANDNQLEYKPQEIVVSVGAKQAIFNLCLALLESGDEAVIPAPYWVSYEDMVELTGATPVPIQTSTASNFKINGEMLRKALTDKTRLLFLNSPSNPTGKIYSKEELQELGAVLHDFPQITVVSDEIYEHILWEGEFCNLVNACPDLKDRVVIINGVSKCYAMTGWRIGYAAGNETIIKAVKKLQSQSTSNPSSIAQYAAVGALAEGNSEIPKMNAEFKKRHDYMAEQLAAIDGVEVVPADGTFYLFPSVEGLIERLPDVKNDMTLCSFLLDKAEVAVVPGSAFGAPGYIRLSYAAAMDQIQTAMERLHKVCKA